MPDAYMTSLLDSIKADLEAAVGDFSQSFTVNKKYRVRYDIKDLQSTVITVAPVGFDFERVSRQSKDYIGQITVGVQKDLPGNDDSNIDDLESMLYLHEELYLWLDNRDLSNDWQFDDITGVVGPSDEHLKSYNVFTGTISISFKKQVAA